MGADFAVPSSSSPSASNWAPLAKPSPPARAPPDPRECRLVAKAKSISFSPAPPPQHAPSELFTVNLSGSASPPSQERSAHPFVQGAPLCRVRIPRSGRHPGGRSQDMMPEAEEVSAPHELRQDSQMYKGAGKAGNLRGDPRPVRPRGGFRDRPPRGDGRLGALDSCTRAHAGSRAGERRESPSFPHSSKQSLLE